MNARNTLAIIFTGIIALSHSYAQHPAEIDELEHFALAENRATVLTELVPGSDAAYYLHALYALNEGHLPAFAEIYNNWKKDRNGVVSADMQMLENRFNVLLYKQDPKRATAAIRKTIGWQPTHSRQTPDQQSDAPNSLDNAQLATQRLLDEKFGANDTSLSFLSSEGLHLAATHPKLTRAQRRDLLSRLTRPVCPNLVALVAADLDEKDSRGFGSIPLHTLLTLPQLQELIRLRPALKEEKAVVEAILARLVPTDAVNLATNPTEQLAYLDRLWTHVSTLSAAHNSLKALVLYNRLVFDETQNGYDRDRFLSYLKLPRQAPHLQPRFSEDARRKDGLAPLGVTFDAVPLPPVPSDEPLVGRFLLFFLKDEPDTKAFSFYLNDDFLKPLFAEAKIVNCVGKPNDWASLLSPEDYRQIRERVDLDLSPHNPLTFEPDTPVTLDGFIKNVTSLTVKIYEINTLNYYRLENAPLDLAMNLDGLVTSETLSFTYDEPAQHRIRRAFPLPSLNRRGVWIVEFIGNGKSSRALIQKGRLNIVEEQTAAGHAFRVFDEQGRLIPDATASLDGRQFKPNDKGIIFVPFSTASQTSTLLVQADGFATRHEFKHLPEKYIFKAGFYIDREALLAGNKADVLIRPALTIHDQPVSLALLENVKLTVRTTDINGLPTERTFSDLTFQDNQEAVVSLAVPEGLVDMTFELTASIRNLSTGAKDALTASTDIQPNGITKTKQTYGIFFGHDTKGYYAECRGLNGEMLANRQLPFFFSHRMFTGREHLLLKTDDNGRIQLGALADISSFWIRLENRSEPSWSCPLDQYTMPKQLHGATDKTLLMPITWSPLEGGQPLDGVSLLETRGGRFVKDWSTEALAVADGFLRISGLPPGDFSLAVPNHYDACIVRIIEPLPPSNRHFSFSEDRMLETPAAQPLNIQSITAKDKTLEIVLANANATTRVHVTATRFCDEYPFSRLAQPQPNLTWSTIVPTITRYESGRELGDEHRYILDRQTAPKFPGNMLEHPTLLLNPWERRDTSTDLEQLAKSTAYNSPIVMRGIVGSRSPGQLGKALSSYGGSRSDPVAVATLSYDFLAQPAVVQFNLKPDANGRLTIPRETFRDLPFIQVIAIDSTSTILRTAMLPDTPTKVRERRLANGLDPAKPAAMRKLVTAVPKDASVTISDFTTARFVLCDTVEKAFGVLSALTPDSTLNTFSFITRWSTLDPAEQRRLYSEFTCHELHLFLYHKDRVFFDTVIAPNLANKRLQTFVDEWLLGADLTKYLASERYARLNAAERALLTRRLPPAEAATVIRDMADTVACLTPSTEDFNRRFDTALRLGALETEESAAQAEMKVAADMRFKREHEEIKRLSLGSAPTASKSVNIASMDIALMDGAAAPPPPPPPPAEMEEAGIDSADVAAARETTRIFFRQAEKTKEWAENNYWQKTVEEQDAALVPNNRFWSAYAAHDSAKPFLPADFLEADSSFTEIMLALAVVDLPFTAGQHIEKVEAPAYTVTVGSNALLIHREIQTAEPADSESSPILVVQRFFRDDDRYEMIDGEKVEKEVSDEFLAGIVYGAQVVLANATPQKQKINTIIQIPEGALPSGGSSATRDEYIEIEPYATLTRDYFFYFPEPGSFAQFPATASDQHGRHLASADPTTFHVVEKLSTEDKTSWAWISQNGSEKDVLDILETHNIRDIENRLGAIGWRMKDAQFFTQTLAHLRSRHIYAPELWGYAFLHHDTQALGEFLQHNDFSRKVGPVLRTTLFNIDPVEHNHYEHLEYAPLINPRTHRVGHKLTILNEALRTQYQSFLEVLCFKSELDSEDQLAAVYYLLLQDRIPEALARFARIDRNAIAEKMQFDYMQAYLALYRGDVPTAAAIAERHSKEGVDKWRVRFEQLSVMVQAIADPKGATANAADPENRDATLGALVSTETTLELSVETGVVKLAAQHIDEVVLNIYPMDIEPLFSNNPFLREGSDRFAIVQPAFTMTAKVKPDGAATTLDIPAPYNAQNIMIEAVAGGIRRSAVSTATKLDVRIIENYGQLIVLDTKTGAPVPGAYVKVYAKTNRSSAQSGQSSETARFHKDGYTDLRGRFDYYSLNPGSAPYTPERLAILIMSPERGAIIKEASPPRE